MGRPSRFYVIIAPTVRYCVHITFLIGLGSLIANGALSTEVTFPFSGLWTSQHPPKLVTSSLLSVLIGWDDKVQMPSSCMRIFTVDLWWPEWAPFPLVCANSCFDQLHGSGSTYLLIDLPRSIKLWEIPSNALWNPRREVSRFRTWIFRLQSLRN